MVARVLSGKIPSSLDSILNMKDEIIDRELVLKGRFEDEIIRLNQAKADAEEKIGIIATIEQAAQLKKEADDYALATKSEADSIRANAQSMLAAAMAREKAVDERDKSVTARENLLASKAQALNDLQARLDATEGERASAHLIESTALKAKEADLVKREAVFSAGLSALAARERKFNERLDALKINS